jgi:pimeloyl-ACP methyl ester carboxylesterase
VIAALGPPLEPLAPERPGWNGSTRALDLRGNADAAAAALDAPAIVVGHSLGAGVAAWLAVLYPRRVQALVLVSPAANPAALDGFDEVLAAPVVGSVLSGLLLGAVGGALSLPAVRRLLGRRLGLDPDFLRSGSRLLVRPHSWHSFEVEQRALFRDLPALEPRLREITAPTTIISGTADRVVPPQAVRLLATQIPGARLEFIDGAGHLLPQRHAAAIARAVSESSGS